MTGLRAGADADSPTRTVGGAAAGLPTIEHAERVQSLDNVFSVDELRERCTHVAAELGSETEEQASSGEWKHPPLGGGREKVSTCLHCDGTVVRLTAVPHRKAARP
ncbi:hypothetical protein JOF43_003879 [Brachybacterium sacelli]|uniref:Uncharacterized protein n=1 Tax=Brachybacterium sacelli TaxID=173364 RepID=A0ABS4X634_9MICO|nr:hypothetical protein [Brachybacterium sacelli]